MSTPDSRPALSKASPDTAEAGVPPLELRLSEGVPPETTSSQPRCVEPSRTPTRRPPLLPDEVWALVASNLEVEALGRLGCTARRFATPFSEAHRANASKPQLSVIEEGARLAVERIIDELADRSVERRRASSRYGQEGGGVAIRGVDGNQSASSWLRTLWDALRPLEFESRLCGPTVATSESGQSPDASCSILVQ